QPLHRCAPLLGRGHGTRVIEAWYACSGDSDVAVATVRGARQVPGSNLSTGSEAPLHFPSSPPPWRSSVPRFRAPGGAVKNLSGASRRREGTADAQRSV